MTPTQLLLFLEFLMNKNDTITEFSWKHTDGVLHIHFFDAGGNKHHKSFNSLGHVIDWED